LGYFFDYCGGWSLFFDKEIDGVRGFWGEEDFGEILWRR